MNLGVQYYRPPFPIQKHWIDDLHRIRESGLDTIQLWVTWAWVESKPGEFRFDDYDRLVDLADQAGLSVILSTIAELQPHWIHDMVPNSEMIDNFGHRVVSSMREESNFGLTPGGCTENPAVWDRMANFLREVVLHYRELPNLAGWDAWNELRWHEQSDALVCFCPHCLRGFRQWLDSRYGGLDGLNEAWQRRYGNWEEVMPGKLPWRPFTEMIAWQRFVTWKANQHGKRRYDLIKALDPDRAVTVHAGDPSPLMPGNAESPFSYALDRGNDWFYADDIDGIGCSSFPKLFGMDDTDFTTRVSFVRSAARSSSRKLWLSEVQGGRGSMGFQPTAAVTKIEQQRWIWRGVADGADKLLFWCWRDEIFGRETAGFGLAGNDGHADARLSALSHTSQVLAQHGELISDFEQLSPEVGVLFSPSTYYLHWALDGNAVPACNALTGYCKALSRLSIPFLVVEEEHLECLDHLKVLFLPRTIVMSDEVAKALHRFVETGGILICESECGAFTAEGIYRAPEERFLTTLGMLPGREVGRRDLQDTAIRCELPGVGPISITATQWLTPWAHFPELGRIFSEHEDGVVIGDTAYGEGRVIYCGSFFGDVAAKEEAADFDRFVGWCCHSITPPPLASIQNDGCQIRAGLAGGKPFSFVFLPPDKTTARLSVEPGYFPSGSVTDLISGETYSVSQESHHIEIVTTDHGVAALVDNPS